MGTRAQVLRLLADGALHSGSDLGRSLDISRAAVCKHVHALAAGGLTVQRVPGRGYRLDAPLRPLEKRRILGYLGAEAEAIRRRLTIVERVDSTNRYLLGQPSAGPAVCLAEGQTQGRGRRGRAWVATPYHNLLLSVAWRFEGGPGLVAGLSLAAGVAVLRALDAYGVQGVGLKWPNDVLWAGRKLAGVLTDVQGEAAGPTRVVLGVGVNGYIAPAQAHLIDQPWVDLQSIRGEATDRNRLAALLIRCLQDMARAFALGGFGVFREEWERRHVYTGRAVRLVQGGNEVRGRIEGVDDSGALRLRTEDGALRVFPSGEISLRPAP